MSPVEQTIEAVVIVDLAEPQIKVDINEASIITIREDEKIIELGFEILPELYTVYVDLDNLYSPSDSTIPIIRFNTYLPIRFNKAVSARRKTFGKTSLAITNNRIINGAIDSGRYGAGAYGSGKYNGGSALPVTHYGASSLSMVLGRTTSGTTTPKQTAIAEISLAFHGTPSVRKNHSIKFRARTISGSTGVIKAALYEGATNRSGTLTSSPLTNAFADYTLPISDAVAASITSYSNLSIRIWGYHPSGTALIFQVSRLYLELPI